MMSRLLSLLRVFGPSRVRSNYRPNSYAAISLWRKFFAYKEEQEEAMIEDLRESLERPAGRGGVSLMRVVRPVGEVHQERREFARDGNRPLTILGGLLMEQHQQSNKSSDAEIMRQHEEQQVERPNLDVPLGEEYLYLPQ